MYHNISYSIIPIRLRVILIVTTANVVFILNENGVKVYRIVQSTTVLIILLSALILQYLIIVQERYGQCTNTKVIKERIRIAFILFLLIEFIAFNSLFWGYFHFTLTETWPPVGVTKCNPFRLPFLNTCLLLTSAMRLTVFHDYILQKKHNNYTRLKYLHATIILGAVFILIQYDEYKDHLIFRLSDGIYGSIFYSLTGFHGRHVIIGIVILIATLNLSKYATYSSHKGINAAIWYWHFVDVIWIFLFIFVYIY